MNMLFKSPEEAINACNEECNRCWEEYLKVNKLDTNQNPDAIAAAQSVFRQGYMAGARFVSGVIVEKMMNHAKNHVIQPDQQ